MNLRHLAKTIYDANVAKGGHIGPPDLAKFLVNLHSEIERRSRTYSSALSTRPKRSASDIESAVERKMAFNATRPHRPGGKLA